MILTAHQPVYLPWLGLFHKIALADKFVSFNRVQYQTDDWNNRNRIRTRDGVVWLSVPVVHTDHFQRSYPDIRIDNTKPWARKHWNSIQMTYGRAPYFKRYADFFEDCYKTEWATLLDLNEHMLRWFLDVLGIKVPVLSAGDWSFEGAKSSLVLDMCRQLAADVFIFGALGRDYADVAAFTEAGVQPLFQDYRHPTYEQRHEGFVSHLSIVDLLFNRGDDSLDILMSGNVGRDQLLTTQAWR